MLRRVRRSRNHGGRRATSALHWVRERCGAGGKKQTGIHFAKGKGNDGKGGNPSRMSSIFYLTIYGEGDVDTSRCRTVKVA